MKTRKHQCRVQLAASEPVVYRLVVCISLTFINLHNPPPAIATPPRPVTTLSLCQCQTEFVVFNL